MNMYFIIDIMNAFIFLDRLEWLCSVRIKSFFFSCEIVTQRTMNIFYAGWLSPVFKRSLRFSAVLLKLRKDSLALIFFFTSIILEELKYFWRF